MQDVVIAEGIEVAVALEAAREPADAVAALEDGDVLQACPGQRVGGRHAGQAASEDDDRGLGRRHLRVVHIADLLLRLAAHTDIP